MPDVLRFVGPEHAAELFGIRLIGVNAENGAKLLVSLLFIAAVVVLSRLLQRLASRHGPSTSARAGFWTRQAIRLLSAVVLTLGLFSIWFDEPARLATAVGLMSAGLAFALQRVITALAGYFIILRGDVFNVGDRIVMGGVRGDVIGLTFMQTKIMEMGQPPPVQTDDPAMWVKSRQYTGRIVSVSNAKIFDEPVYNYTHEFPYIWEEIALPVAYKADRSAAEHILLEAARRHSAKAAELGKEALEALRRRYEAAAADVEPRVFWRITDNWLELSVRFLCPEHGVREVKDAIARDVLTALDDAGIGIASATFELTGLPALRFERAAAGEVSRDNGSGRSDSPP
jgi:small-conductance mechanosensitive channel